MKYTKLSMTDQAEEVWDLLSTVESKETDHVYATVLPWINGRERGYAVIFQYEDAAFSEPALVVVFGRGAVTKLTFVDHWVESHRPCPGVVGCMNPKYDEAYRNRIYLENADLAVEYIRGAIASRLLSLYP